MDIAILFGLILLNGFFAMSEIALVAARKARLQNLAQQGDKTAATALRLGEDPTFFLSAVQIGITSIGVLNGIVGEAALSPPFSAWLQTLGVEEHIANPLATGLVVVSITYFSIVLGELVPKRLGQMSPEGIARFVARPMLWLAIIAKPFVMLLSGSTRLLLRILGAKDDNSSSVTEEDIHLLLSEGSDAGVIEEQEHQMVRNVFRLDDRQIASFMVPRSDVVCLDVDKSLEENLSQVEAHRYSRFPVVRGNWDEVLGIVSTSQLLNQMLRGEQPSLSEHLKPAVFVPESLTGMELLENFKDSGGQMVFIIDEYGEVQGIVTLHDMMEAITGEFKPQHQDDAWAVQREDGSWLLDGLIPVPELKDRLGFRSVPEEDKGRYHTLSGMLMLLLGRLPQTADHCDWEGWRLEVVDMDGTRIDKVLASALLPDSEGTSSD
ncbi:MAG TPA: hemolysin family protein [Candidatus Thiothrix moscowensis]|uniref:hemolysin family protein n=1 Tax=unclassified Thiothrix TaxID=2636184 RepID=UPI0025E0A0B5|nr:MULTISPECIES: hemolysin family protein [unclassified Thiothrix]HRJ52767.1 hemolysin family protein [Candidatus Thiothrix moscowensis]HRJ92749.1 hemolysin family protein [Candidatus Thiothrix moscowensis]